MNFLLGCAGRRWVLGVGLLATMGCGGQSENEDPTRGSSGGAAPAATGGDGLGGGNSGGASPHGSGGAAGGSANGSGGTAGGIPSAQDDTRVAACRAYVQTQCERIMECRGTFDESSKETCERTAVESCPEALFLEGSQHTKETVLECTERWAAFDCDALLNGEIPECTLIPGDRADGEPCLYQSQCQNGCTSDTYTCGVCAPHAFETCGSDDVCVGHGAYCDEGKCKTLAEQGYPRPPDDAGALPPEVEDPVELPSLGEPCVGVCEGDLLCYPGPEGEEHECRAAKAVGDDCYSTPVADRLAYFCGSSLVCAPDTHTCQVPGGDGEPCFEDAAGKMRCVGGAYCDADHICRIPGDPGTPCLHPVDRSDPICREGLSCVDDTCSFLVPWKESGCSSPQYSCEHGTHCVDDVCLANDAVVDFDALCAP